LGTEVTDDGMKNLQGLTELRTLDLCDTDVGDRGIEQLATLKKLEGLLLAGTPLSDSGLAQVALRKELRVLNLGGTAVTDDGLQALAGLEQLQVLHANDTKITDRGLVHLQGLANLRILLLSNTTVTDAGLGSVKGLKELELLGLHGTEVTDAGFVHLKDLGQLKTLELAGTAVTGAGFEHLRVLPRLDTLVLHDSELDDAGLRYVSGLQELTLLNLSRTRVTGDAITKLRAALPNCRIIWDGAGGRDPNTATKSDAVMAPTLGQAPPLAIAPFDAAEAKQHQRAWAQYLGVPEEITNSIGMELVLIPPGEFMMGSTPDEITWAQNITKANRGKGGFFPERPATEGPQHRVKISVPLYVGAYEVTQSEYAQIMGTNPSSFSANGRNSRSVQGEDTSRHPVEMVTWEDSVEFCRRLSARPDEKAARRLYRLPTEAEWEYTCRAGTTTRWCCGDDPSMLSDFAWLGVNSDNKTHAVGNKKPNAWSLFDQHGNIWEWCADRHGPKYYAESTFIDPVGPASGRHRVTRGGGYDRHFLVCRSTYRGVAAAPPWPKSGPAFGFRVVAEIVSR
jgi:formylglycine-generating enzyme required for sulfatase activity